VDIRNEVEKILEEINERRGEITARARSRGGVYTGTFYTAEMLKHDFKLFKELLEKERAR